MSETTKPGISRRTVVAGAAWTAPAIVAVSAAPAFATSPVTNPAIVISDRVSVRTSDEAGNTPSTTGNYWNLKFNVTLPVGTSITGLIATITCTGATTNGLTHKGGVTNPAAAAGSRGAFVFSAGLYSNETSGVTLSAPGPDSGGTITVPAYTTWRYAVPDALLVAGTTAATVVPLQFTFMGLGNADVPINVAFTQSTVSPGGVTGANFVCAVASTGALTPA